MCSGSKAGSHLRLIDCVYQSTLGVRVIKKIKASTPSHDPAGKRKVCPKPLLPEPHQSHFHTGVPRL